MLREVFSRHPTIVARIKKTSEEVFYGCLGLEGQEGLEPSTFCLRGRRSNQLSYWPIAKRDIILPKYLCYGKVGLQPVYQCTKLEISITTKEIQWFHKH